MKGKLVHWDQRNGTGRIKGDDGQDYFVHYTELAQIENYIRGGEAVQFEPSRISDHVIASNVEILSGLRVVK